MTAPRREAAASAAPRETAAMMPRSWFDDLCREHGLTALPPLTAADLRPGLFTFTVTGTPREIVKVRRNQYGVTVTTSDGWVERFAPLDTRLSLIGGRP